MSYQKVKTLAAGCLFAVGAILPLAGYAQSSLPEVVSQTRQETAQLSKLISSGDSIMNSGPMSSTDSAYIKQYQRWRRDAVAHATYEGAPVNATVADLKAYMSNIPLFCNQGPANHSWSSVGPHPRSSSYQEIGIIKAVAVDPTNSDIIYVGTEESGMWKTTDGGLNWSHITQTLDVIGIGITSIEVSSSNSNRIIAGTIAHSFTYNPTAWGGPDGVGVIVSNDGGATWNVSSYVDNGVTLPYGSMGFISELKFSPNNNSIVIATGKSAIYRSTDGGLSFEKVYSKPQMLNDNNKLGDGTYINDVEFLPSNPNIVVATCKSSEQRYLFEQVPLDWIIYSTSGGADGTWQVGSLPNTQLPNPNYPGYYLHPTQVFVDATPADPSKLFFVFRTDINYATVNGTAHRHISYQTFGYSSSNMTTFQQEFYDPNPNFIACRLQTGGTLGAYSFHLLKEYRGFQVSDLSTDIWYTSGYTFNRRDNGTWSATTDYDPRCSATPESSTHGDIRDIRVIGQNNGKDILLIADDGGIARSDDGGTSWNNINGHGLTISQFWGFDFGRNNTGFIGSAIHNGSYQIEESGNWRAFVGIVTDGEYAEKVYFSDGSSVDIFLEGVGSKSIQVKSAQGGWRKYIGSAPLGRRFSADPTWRSLNSQGDETRKIYVCTNDVWSVEVGPIDDNVSPQLVFDRAIYLPPDNSVQPAKTIDGPVSMVRFSESNPLVGYLAMEGLSVGSDPYYRKMLWKTTDGGATWLNINNQFTIDGGTSYVSDRAYVSDILIHPDDEDMVFVSMTNFSKNPNNGYGTKRVLLTTNGGQSWSDYSNLLPAVPANTLALDGHILYVGTDAGVYYMNINNPQPSDNWTCFNRDLPNAMVEHLRIDPCVGKVYASMRGLGIWEAPVIPTSEQQITISGNPTWSNIRYVSGDIVIPFNTHLTLTGKLLMGKSSQIIIESGGQLTIDGGSITTYCGDFWGGIYVAGTGDQPQTIQHQGKLSVVNGGEIANARDGITNTNINGVTGNWIPQTTGGIINLNGAVFRNNRRDIQLLRHPYSIDNKLHYNAQIYNCQFIKDDNFAIEAMLPSITMWDVHGIIVKGSDFTNQNTGTFEHQGGGIYAINALFKVDEDLQGGCNFEGFAEAIRSENYTLPLLGNGEIEIRNSDFTDNLHSIYISGANLSSVIDNRIHVPNPIGPSVQNPPKQPAHYGIYMDMCPDFDVRQNYLKTDGPNGAVTTVGIVVNNSGGNNNNIYKNEIDGFTVGLEAIGDNRNSGNSAALDGLFYRCNILGSNSHWSTSHGNSEDIYVSPLNNLISPSSGVALNHGYDPRLSSTLPNNLFKNSGYQYQFENKTVNTHNYYFEESASSVEPGNVLDVVKHQIYVPGFEWGSYCVDLPEAESMSIGTLQSNITTLESDLSEDLSLRDELLNGGNSPALEAAILFADDQGDYQNLYVEMMNMSPYVEDQMLLDLISIEDYPELALRNILIANPHGARNPEIWEALATREPLLSQQTLDDIEQERQTITAFDVLQMSIGHTRAELEYNKTSLVRRYLTVFEEQQTNLMNFLSNEDDPTYLYILTEAHLANGNISSANTVISGIPSACDLSHEETEEYNSLASFYGIVSSVLENPEAGLNELDGSSITSLLDIVNNGYGIAVGKAYALLSLNGVEAEYIEPILLPGGGSGKTSVRASAASDRPATVQFDVRVYPNPAEGMARIEWNPVEFVDVDILTVQISSMEGRVVFQAEIEDVEQSFYPLDLSNVTPGAYLVSLRSKEGELYNTTLIIR